MGKKTILLFKLFVAVFCLLPAAWIPANPVSAAGVSCQIRYTPEFFVLADAADISRCLKSRNPGARNGFGVTLLHTAARNSTTPEAVAA